MVSVTEDDVTRLKSAVREDRKLIARAAEALAQIDRADGLSDEHADVLASLRIRLEGRARSSLEDLLSAAGDIGGKKDLGDVLPSEQKKSDWPSVEQRKKEWPGL